MSRKVGLFVGINKYTKDDSLTLSYASKDAVDMAKLFGKRGYEAHLLTDKDATANKIKSMLESITKTLNAGDMFIFYFSGHGAEFERKHLLICSDYDSHMYAKGSITLNKVAQITGKENVERLFIIDSCRVKWDNDNEKAMVPNNRKKELYQYIVDTYNEEAKAAKADSDFIYNKIAEPVILTSCSSGETSIECSGHGFFTRHLLNVLLSNSSYLTYRGLVFGLANSIGTNGQHPAEMKPLNANPLIFGDRYRGDDYVNKPGCLLGFLGWLTNLIAGDGKKTEICSEDDPVLIKRLNKNDKCSMAEKKFIYNVSEKNGDFIQLHIAEDDVGTNMFYELDGTNFYVSLMSFPIDIKAKLQHKDCPGGIDISTSILIKLHPGTSAFGEWLVRTVKDKVTLTDMTCLLQDEIYGLNLYLQKMIDGAANFGLVSRYGKEAVAWKKQDNALPDWLEIINIQYLDAKALPSDAEERRNNFNNVQQKNSAQASAPQMSNIAIRDIEQARAEYLQRKAAADASNSSPEK
jgi:hypothetical protein